MYKITPLPKNINNFECIILFDCLDSDGTWWMGADKGLYKQEADHHIVAVLKGQYVNDIAFAGESLFVGTSNGVWQLSHALPDKNQEYQAAFDAQWERSRALIEEREAEIRRLTAKIGKTGASRGDANGVNAA